VLVDDVRSCDNDGILDDGETGKLVVTIENTGFSDLVDTTATVTSNIAGLTFAKGGEDHRGKITFPTLRPYASVGASVEVTMTAPAGITPYALTDGLGTHVPIVTRT